MIPSTGQHVKCILRNGAIAEGIVENWAGHSVQLKSLDGESVLIITHPSEDIMLIKIILVKREEDEEPFPTFTPEPDLEEQFDEAAKTTDPRNIDEVKSLAQLRIELNKQERNIIAQRLREHRPGPFKPGTNTTTYHYPPVIMKEIPARNPNGQSRPSKK